MPTYSYKCNTCNHTFTEMNSINNSDSTKCPECGEVATKVWGNAGGTVLIQGKGFYQESKMR